MAPVDGALEMEHRTQGEQRAKSSMVGKGSVRCPLLCPGHCDMLWSWLCGRSVHFTVGCSARPGSVREQPSAGTAVLRAKDVDMCAAKDYGQGKECHTAVGATTDEESYF